MQLHVSYNNNNAALPLNQMLKAMYNACMSENSDWQNNGETLVESENVLKEPEMWKAVLLNDDYTPMDFVVKILVSIFHKSPVEAAKIMRYVHKKGRGVGGVYPYDIAKTKAAQVTEEARKHQYPLKCIIEKA